MKRVYILFMGTTVLLCGHKTDSTLRKFQATEGGINELVDFCNEHYFLVTNKDVLEVRFSSKLEN